MIMKNLAETSPAPNDSTIRIRTHLRTKWLYEYENFSWDFTRTQWINYSNTSSPQNQTTVYFWKISRRLHLHPMTEPFEYEVTLEPNDHLLMKNLPQTSPAADDSTIRIRVHLRIKWPKNLPKTSTAPNDSTIRTQVHLRTKWPYDYEKSLWPYDYEKSPQDFACNPRWLNHTKTSSP